MKFKIMFFALLGLIFLVFLVSYKQKIEITDLNLNSLKGIIKLAIWDISTASYDEKYLNLTQSLGGPAAAPYDVDFSEDGLKVFVTKSNNISQYNLTTPWDLNTSTYANNTFNFTANQNNGNAEIEIEFCNGGTKLYLMNSTSRIFQYSMSQPYNVSNLSYDGIVASVLTQMPNPGGSPLAMFINSTCTGVYLLDSRANSNRSIWRYTMNAADLSTLTYSGDRGNVSNTTHGINAGPRGMRFKPDGTKVYLVDQVATDRVSQYTTSFTNLNSTFYDVKNFTTDAYESQSRTITINDSGNKFYILGSSNNTIFQFSMNDTQAPQWSLNYTNGTAAGSTVNHTTNWTDDVALSGYIFSFDNGNGSFLNDTWVSLSSVNSTQVNVSKSVNSSSGITIQWKVYVNDTTNNLNVTDTFSYVTTSAGNCWGITADGDLYVPSGCTYYIDSSGGYFT